MQHASARKAARHKPLALPGYGLAAVTKPLFPLRRSVAMVFTARFIERSA